MVPGIVLAASHKCPGNMDRRFPLDKAHHLRHRVLRGNGEEHVHVIGHQVPLFNTTFLLRRDRKSTRLNSSHRTTSYAVFCLKKKNSHPSTAIQPRRRPGSRPANTPPPLPPSPGPPTSAPSSPSPARTAARRTPPPCPPPRSL